MTNLEMNAEFFRNLSVIAEDESLMTKLLKYTKKLVSTRSDSTEMSKKEFAERVKEARKGSSKSFDNIEELDRYIRSL